MKTNKQKTLDLAQWKETLFLIKAGRDLNFYSKHDGKRLVEGVKQGSDVVKFVFNRITLLSEAGNVMSTQVCVHYPFQPFSRVPSCPTDTKKLEAMFPGFLFKWGSGCD